MTEGLQGSIEMTWKGPSVLCGGETEGDHVTLASLHLTLFRWMEQLGGLGSLSAQI